MNKSIIVATVLLAILGYAQSQQSSSIIKNKSVTVKGLTFYNKWKTQHQRVYLNEEEELFRQSVFLENFQKIDQHNTNPNNTYTIGTNQYTDMTKQEFKQKILNPQLTKLSFYDDDQENDNNQNKPSFDSDSSPIDWRKKGAVTQVKKQGNCGACWTFATVGLMESYNYIKNNQLVSLSEQQLIDCVTNSNGYESYGCNGGYAPQALAYAAKFGIQESSQYPYVGVQGECKVSNPTSGFYPKSFRYLDRTSDALQQALQSSPVAVVVDGDEWFNYSSGIFNGCKSKLILNHSVLVVGYDSNNNWIVKNSWGASWGESGYIRVAAGNTCGILTSAQVLTD